MQDNPVQATGLSSNKVVTTEIPWVSFGSSSNNNISLNNIGHLYNVSSVDFSNFLGFNALTQSAKLLMYLRYGNFLASTSDVTKSSSVGLSSSLDLRNSESGSTGYSSVHILPLAAYQKVYADFFRFSQWEKNQPYTYNFDWYQGSGNLFSGAIDTTLPASSDYWKRDNLFSLRYCNWNKDLFMGILPNSQFGDIAFRIVTGKQIGRAHV